MLLSSITDSLTLHTSTKAAQKPYWQSKRLQRVSNNCCNSFCNSVSDHAVGDSSVIISWLFALAQYKYNDDAAE